jgi:hypothetical protein
LTTVRNSSTQVVVTIPIRCAGSYKIQVENPQPGGGLSAVATLAVPATAASTSALTATSTLPVIASIDATQVGFDASTTGGSTVDQPVVIVGNNFSPNAQVWVNLACDDLGFRKASSSTTNSSTLISATVPVACAGTYQVEVQNPEIGGGFSAPVSLVVPRIAEAGTIPNRLILPSRQVIN